MADFWFARNDYDVFSGEEVYDSDIIDSDVETALYSSIHHEVNDELEDGSNDDVISSSNDTSVVSLNSESSFKENNTSRIKIQDFPNDKESDNLVKNSEKLSSNSVIEVHCGKSRNDCILKEKSIHKTVNPGKKKSHLISSVIDDIQVQSSRDSLMTTHHVGVQFLTVSDDSDSSSVVWSDPENADISLNIKHQTVEISSDSDDSNYALKHYTTNQWKNGSASSSKPRNGNENWLINEDDFYRSKRSNQRYHEKAQLFCNNCNGKGHVAKFCPVRKALKCFFCGSYHMSSSCKLRVCYKCYHVGHDPRGCYRMSSANVKCFHCLMLGHLAEHCPDLWRRYHLSVSKTLINGKKPRNVSWRDNVYCSNCGMMGHIATKCDGPRMDRWTFQTWTSVISYAKPIKTLNNIDDTFNNGRRSNDNLNRPPVMREEYIRADRRLMQREKNLLRKRRKMMKEENEKKVKKIDRALRRTRNKMNTSVPEVIAPEREEPKSRREIYFPRTPKPKPDVPDRGRDWDERKRETRKQRQHRRKHKYMNMTSVKPSKRNCYEL